MIIIKVFLPNLVMAILSKIELLTEFLHEILHLILLLGFDTKSIIEILKYVDKINK